MKLSELIKEAHLEEIDINLNIIEDEDNPDVYSLHISHDGASGVKYRVSTTKEIGYCIEDYIESNL